MTEKTPEQPAYEAYDAAIDPVDDFAPHNVPYVPWEDVRTPERDAWEAAVEAHVPTWSRRSPPPGTTTPS